MKTTAEAHRRIYAAAAGQPLDYANPKPLALWDKVAGAVSIVVLIIVMASIPLGFWKAWELISANW